MASKEFLEIVDKMREIHIKKSADYASESEPLANFKITAELVSHFKNPIDQVFVTLIGVKMARLSELLNNNKEPKNEAIIDTFVDGPNYFALWGAAHLEASRANQELYENGVRLHLSSQDNRPAPASYPPSLNDTGIRDKMMMDAGYLLDAACVYWIHKHYRPLEHRNYIRMNSADIAQWLDIQRRFSVETPSLKHNG